MKPVKKRKNKRKNKSLLKKFVILIAVLVAAFTSVYTVSHFFGTMPITGIITSVRAHITGDDGGLFPIHISTVNTILADSYDEGFFVLTDTDIKIYDFTGKEKLVKEHKYTSPAVTKGKYGTFLYDRSGTKYMLLKGSKEVEQGESNYGDILTAAVGRRGNKAFSVRGSDATSKMYVVNRQGKEIFVWNCAYLHTTSIALSDNGKYVAAACVGAKDGDVVSTVYIFGFQYSEELYTHTFEGETILKIKYLSNRLLYIFTDGGIYTVKGNKELTKQKSYYRPELGFYSDAKNAVSALVMTKYGGNNIYELNISNRKGNIVLTKEINANVLSLNTNGKYVFILADKGILVYNLKGEIVNEIKIDKRYEKLFGSSRHIFLCSADKIEREFTQSLEKGNE